MSQFSEAQYQESGRAMREDANRDQTAWVGWIVFAAAMMVLLGVFHVLQGLVALVKDDYFIVGHSGLVVSADYTIWGWVHLIGGLVIAGAGLALFAGRMWGRVVGVVMAMVSAVVNVGFLAAFPVWSVLMILIDVLVIWALTVHGSELRRA